MILDYQKDVLHYKEQQLKIMNSNEQLIEVKYFDQQDGLDESQRLILNQVLTEVKFKYERHLYEMKKMV